MREGRSASILHDILQEKKKGGSVMRLRQAEGREGKAACEKNNLDQESSKKKVYHRICDMKRKGWEKSKGLRRRNLDI